MTIFILTSRYVRPLVEVDAKLSDHIAWVTRQYREGRILVSGRQTPPVGGAIVMVAANESEVFRELSSDPFYAEGLADYSCIAFEQTMAPRRSQAYELFIDSTSRVKGVVD